MEHESLDSGSVDDTLAIAIASSKGAPFYRNIRVAGISTPAIIDTGASRSLCSSNIAEKCRTGGASEVQGKSVKFCSVDRAPLPTEGVIRTSITVDGEQHPIDLHVMNKMVAPVIVGYDWLAKYIGQIDVQSGQLIHRPERKSRSLSVAPSEERHSRRVCEQSVPIVRARSSSAHEAVCVSQEMAHKGSNESRNCMDNAVSDDVCFIESANIFPSVPLAVDEIIVSEYDIGPVPLEVIHIASDGNGGPYSLVLLADTVLPPLSTTICLLVPNQRADAGRLSACTAQCAYIEITHGLLRAHPIVAYDTVVVPTAFPYSVPIFNANLQPVYLPAYTHYGTLYTEIAWLDHTRLADENSEVLAAAIEERTVTPTTSVFSNMAATEEPFDPATIDMSDSDMSPAGKRMMLDVFVKHKDVWARSLKELPRCKIGVQRIPLKPGAVPFHQRPYPCAESLLPTLKSILMELLDARLIRPSASAWGSPALLVKKGKPVPGKPIKWRLCVDMRRINSVTLRDAFPQTVPDGLFRKLHGANLFFSADLRGAYWTVPVHEKDIHKTAFTTAFGKFEWLVSVMGSTTAQDTLSRILQLCLSGFDMFNIFHYADDLLVASCNETQLCTDVDRLLGRLVAAGFALAPDKLQVGKKSVPFLGHVISANGLSVPQARVAAVKAIKVPRTRKEMRSFLGFARYYGRFVDHFSERVKPLQPLTLVDSVWKWGKREQAAFDDIVNALSSPPVLAFPHFGPDAPQFEIETDASNYALAAVCLQQQQAQRRVIYYASRKCTATETTMPSTHLELLAVHFAFRIFTPYILGQEVLLITDCKPLLSILRQRTEINPRLARPLLEIQSQAFKAIHRPGKDMVGADFLSRARLMDSYADGLVSLKEPVLPVVTRAAARAKRQSHTEEVSAPALRTNKSSLPVTRAPLEMTAKTRRATEVAENCLAEGSPKTAINISAPPEALRQRQLADPHLSALLEDVADGIYPLKTRFQSPIWRSLVDQRQRYVIQEGVLRRKCRIGTAKSWVHQLVVPADMRRELLDAAHDDPLSGHFGVARTLDAIRNVAYWPRMADDVATYISACAACARLQTGRPDPKSPPQHAPLATRPGQVYATDVCGPFPSSKQYRFQYIVTVQDQFSRVFGAFPLKTCNSVTTMGCVLKFSYRYGFPQAILTDNAAYYTSAQFSQMLGRLGIFHIRIAPLRPCANGQLERAHASLERIIRTFVDSESGDWSEVLDAACYAMNTLRSDALGCSPMQLMFTATPITPLALLTGTLPAVLDDDVPFVQQWQKRVSAMARAASQRIERRRAASDANFKPARTLQYGVGDTVLILRPQPPVGVSAKLYCPYQSGYRIAAVRPFHVYEVELIADPRRRYVVQHDRLRPQRPPIGEMPLPSEAIEHVYRHEEVPLESVDQRAARPPSIDTAPNTVGQVPGALPKLAQRPAVTCAPPAEGGLIDNSVLRAPTNSIPVGRQPGVPSPSPVGEHKVQFQSGPPEIIPHRARSPPPTLDLSEVDDVPNTTPEGVSRLKRSLVGSSTLSQLSESFEMPISPTF